MSVVTIYTAAEARATILRRGRGKTRRCRRRCWTASSASSASASRRPRRSRASCGMSGRGAMRRCASGRSGSTGGRPARWKCRAAEWRAAYERLPDGTAEALDLAAERVAAFHRKQPVDSWVDAGPDGTLGQLIRPLDRAGVYVPGGTAPLPSSLLMAAIPARVAGVGEVIVCTPPGRARHDPRPDPGRGLRGGRGSALRARRRAGDRGHGLRHRDRAARWTRSWARAACSSPWPSAR